MSAVPASLTPADAGAVNDQRLPRARRPARRANPVEGRGRPRAGVNGGQILPPGPRGLPPARWRRQEQECPIRFYYTVFLRDFFRRQKTTHSFCCFISKFDYVSHVGNAQRPVPC